METSPFGGTETAVAVSVFAMFAIIALVATAVQVLIYCKIFAKAGYHWAYGLLIIVPIAQFIVPFYLAFADWPVEKELRELRQRTGTTPTGYQR